MRPVIDSDQHLFEYRGLWQEHIDPARRDDAIRFVDDPLGHVRVDVARPGALGRRRADARRDGCDRRAAPARARRRSAARALRRDPAARLLGAGRPPRAARGARRRRGDLLPELRARLGAHAPGGSARRSRPTWRAWNRWCETVVREGGGGSTRWRISRCAIPPGSRRSSRAWRRAGVRAAMIAPALVDGKPLSHPDARPRLGGFAHHGVSPIFHVADQPKVFDEAWYTRPRRSRRLRGRHRAALRARGARLHGPDPERRARAPPRSAARHRRALGRVGAAVSDDARRRQPVRAPARRPRLDALAAAERRTSSARCACRRSPTSCPPTSSASSAAPTCSCVAATTRTPRARRRRSPTTLLRASSPCSPDDAPGLFRDNAAFLLRKS